MSVSSLESQSMIYRHGIGSEGGRGVFAFIYILERAGVKTRTSLQGAKLLKYTNIYSHRPYFMVLRNF